MNSPDNSKNKMLRLLLSSLIMSLATLCPVFSIDSSADQSFEPIKSNELTGSTKLNSNLKRIINEISEMAVTRENAQSTPLSDLSNPIIKVDDDGRIEVFIYCNEISDGNLELLLDQGLMVEAVNEDLKIIQGWIPYDKLENAAEMEFVVKLTPPSYAHTRVGSVTTEGDAPIPDGVDSMGVSQTTGDGGCSLASNTSTRNSAVNIILLLMPALVIGLVRFKIIIPCNVVAEGDADCNNVMKI